MASSPIWSGHQVAGVPSYRVTAPPGGKSSIFSPDPTEDKTTPRKVIDYQKSRIFEDDNANEIARKSVSPSPKHAINTQSRLFGENGVDKSPSRRVSDTYRSSVFSPEANIPGKSPRKTIERNPITGKKQVEQNGVHMNGGLAEDVSHQVNGVHNGVHNGAPNGVANGVPNGVDHGKTNGYHSNGVSNGTHHAPIQNGVNGVHNGTEH